MAITPNGNLLIENVQANDAGRYVCVATNMAGSREAKPVELKVLSEWKKYTKDRGGSSCLLRLALFFKKDSPGDFPGESAGENLSPPSSLY